jgi:Na+/H+ antiporter NhaC
VSIFLQFVPILLFVFIFMAAGVYFSILGEENSFSLLPPIIAIIPSLILAWLMCPKSSDEKTADFVGGCGNKDVILMCLVFILSGAFGEVTKEVGCIESVINLSTSIIPARFMLVGVFFVSAILSLSIGSAVGTIAAIGPLAAELCEHTHGFSAPLTMGTVVGGSFFGDNLSMISNATIAAVSSQCADAIKKFKINLKIAVVATMATVLLLWLLASGTSSDIAQKDFSILLLLPYITVLALAFCKVNVLTCLMSGIILAGFIGYISKPNYGIIELSKAMTNGFSKVNNTVLLAMVLGGLSGLTGNGAIKEVGRRTSEFMKKRNKIDSRVPQFVIAGLASISTLFFSNNVIAIIFCGETAKNIADDNEISPHYSATILEVFACGIKGIMPYGVQVLLASSIANISPFSILPYIYYCYMLMIVATLFIFLKDKKDPKLN